MKICASHQQTITTKYFGPTNQYGARIKAITSSGESLTIGRDYAVDAVADFKRAALTLAKKLKWNSGQDMVGGAVKDGYVFVFMPRGCMCR